MTLGDCCCVTNGNFDWYQWDVIGQPAQNYIAMHTAVQPAASIQDWIDFTSWLCDIENPEWKVDTSEIWEADYNGNSNSGLFFTLVGMADLYEGVFYAYEWYSTADSRLEVNVGLANATSETLEWEITRSPGLDEVWPVAPLGYISEIFQNVTNTSEWKNRAEDYQYSALTFLEHNETTPWPDTPFTYGESPADIADGYFSSEGSQYYYGNASMEAVHCNSEETTASRTVCFLLTLHDLKPGTDQLVYPYYMDGDDLHHDTAITYNQSDGEEVHIGSRMVQAWLALEYPGILVNYGDTFHPIFGNIPNYYDGWWDLDKYQSFIIACNNAEAVTRAVLATPRNYPYVFGLRPPKVIFYENEIASTHYPDDSTGPWPLWRVESHTETVELVWGEFVFPTTNPEDTPAYVPSGTRVYRNEKTQGRLAFDGNIGPMEDGDNIAFNSTKIEPMAVWATVKYGDANDLNEWGCIFSSMERDIDAWANGLAGVDEDYYEIITDEKVYIHVRVNNETDIRKFRCYREDDIYRIWDILAVPKIESAQSLPGRYFIWLEQTYTGTQPEDIADSSVLPTKGKIQIRRNKVGETISDILWETSVAVNRTQALRKPHLRLCSDRYYYLSDFQAVWPANKGGDDGTYSHWVCSHEREEIAGSPGSYQPKVFYPWVGPADGFNPWWGSSTWNTWDDAPFIDSIKFSDNNRIAPALGVRTA